MGVCSNKCSSKQPMFKNLVNESFKIVIKRRTDFPTIDSKKHRFQILQTHVKSHTKVLIDHISSNREKLFDTILYVKKLIDENTNIEFHLIGIFILIEIVSNMNKFKQKPLSLTKEIGEETVRVRDSMSFENIYAEGENTIIKIDENLLQFERKFFELIVFCLDQKYKYRIKLFYF